MRKQMFITLIMAMQVGLCYTLNAQGMKDRQNFLKPLRVSENKRFLESSDGKPFFYLGDTAWELFHRLTFEEADYYFENRKRKGFTVIQAVILAELDGLHTPNAYGHLPFNNDDPGNTNQAYFEDVDRFISLALKNDLYIGLLPTWGDKVYRGAWGKGPEIFNIDKARAYGVFLGKRYKDMPNIIWILGGDRNPRDENDILIWRAMAEGIAQGAGGNDKALMTFHPQPTSEGGSSAWFHKDAWLDFNMLQTGHCKDGANYKKVSHDYALMPTKPVMDAEPLYEEHPVCFDLAKYGYSTADDIRKLAYWQLFAGAFGHTYGCHPVWQFYEEKRTGVNAPPRFWKEALDLPGAFQMGYVKKLMLSQRFTEGIPDQSLLAMDNPNDSSYCTATRAEDGHYAFIYTPTGKSLTIDAAKLSGKQLSGRWYNPREGTFTVPFSRKKVTSMTFLPPTTGQGNDWVLVLTALE